VVLPDTRRATALEVAALLLLTLTAPHVFARNANKPRKPMEDGKLWVLTPNQKQNLASKISSRRLSLLLLPLSLLPLQGTVRLEF
jgi:Spy/CpxP family protein refolding chaperone